MENLLRDLLKGKEPSEFTAYDLDSKAYYRTGRKQHLEAAVLFEAAANQAKYEFENDIDVKTNENGVRINHFLNSYARAGFHYYEAGEVEKSIPMLRDVVKQDWLGNGLNNDLHTIMGAYNYLVLNEADNKKSFLNAYEKAIWNCKKIKFEFPMNYTFQEKYFEIALKFELFDMCDSLLPKLKNRRPKKRIPKKIIEEYEKNKA